MAKQKESNENSKPRFMKYREGAKRSFRPNEWYVNREDSQMANRFFTSSKGGVPNNPGNVRSFLPGPSMINPGESAPGDMVVRKNPYGDGEQIVKGESPAFVKPNQRGGAFDPPPVPIEKAGKVKPAVSRKGMSTSVGLMGSGPRRNVAPAGPGM